MLNYDFWNLPDTKAVRRSTTMMVVSMKRFWCSRGFEQVLHKLFSMETTLVSVVGVDSVLFLAGKLSGSRSAIRNRAVKMQTADMLNTM